MADPVGNDPSQPHTLPYATGTRSPWRRAARIGGIAAALLLGALLLLASYVVVRRKVTFLLQQDRCFRFTPAADTVAYTEDPATVARLTGGAFSGSGWATLSQNGSVIAYYLSPDALRRVEQTPGVDIPQGFGPVFLHGRTAPGGNERLVVAKVDPMRSYRAFPAGPSVGDHVFNVSVMKPATLRHAPGVTRTLWSPAGPAVPFGELTLFAGKPDPADDSHFTIDYQTPAGRGTIDGWLRADDTVKLTVRDGPLAPQPTAR